MVGKPRLQTTKDSFKWRAAAQYNQLPAELRKCETLQTFKMNVKAWIKINVSLN